MTATVEETAPAAPPTSAKRRKGGSLGRYILTRALLIIPTVFILVTLVFFVMRATGDPITAALGGRLPVRTRGGVRRGRNGRHSSRAARSLPADRAGWRPPVWAGR